MSKTLYEAWGPEKSIKAFVHYPAGTFPGQDNELKDNTHFNNYGAYEIARCVITGIRSAVPALAAQVNKNVPSLTRRIRMIWKLGFACQSVCSNAETGWKLGGSRIN